MAVDLNLARYTDAERLWLYRKARGYSGEAVAGVFKVGHGAYKAVEQAVRPLPKEWRWAVTLAGTHPGTATGLLIARRRSGLGLRGAARAMGVSHVWLLAMERACDPRIKAFWVARGFKFPGR